MHSLSGGPIRFKQELEGNSTATERVLALDIYVTVSDPTCSLNLRSHQLSHKAESLISSQTVSVMEKQ